MPICTVHGIERIRKGKDREWRCSKCHAEYQQRWRYSTGRLGVKKRVYPVGKYGVRKKLSDGRINPAWTRKIRESMTREQKDKDNARHRLARQKNPEAVSRWMRKANLKFCYGMTLEQYESMLVAQDHRCAICNIHQKDTKNKRLVIDHCHTTKAIRGLLCSMCNSVLGYAFDSAEILEGAASYVRKARIHGSKQN